MTIKISAMSAATTLDGTEKLECVQSSATAYLTPAQVRNYVATQLMHPGYVSGRWYMPFVGASQAAVGGACPANTIRLAPFFVPRTVTINTLGARITTGAASGNIQLGIYASSATTGLPTTLVAHTASISTTSTGLVSSAVVEGSGSVTLPAGLYWMAINADATAGGTVVMQALNVSSINAGHIIGSSTQSNVSTGTNATIACETVAATFNTWTADITGTTSTNATAQWALIHFKVA